jgi:broad-specificity NMP kinase
MRLIIELVGLPGVGKTSLAQTLCHHCQNVRLGRTPYFRNPADIPFFFMYTCKLLPLLLRVFFSKDGGRLRPRDIALMVILNGWGRILNRKARNGCLVLILDEGPICYLTRLRAWGSIATRSSVFKAWWEGMFQQWSSVLNLVIQLDSSNDVLIERIRSRDMWQEVKAMTAGQALDFMENLRAAQSYVIQQILAQPHDVDWVYIDSGLNSVEQIYQQVTSIFESSRAPIDETHEPVHER